MANLENDYHQAVNFAKISERVIRRVKQELNKQRSIHQSLRSDLDAAGDVNASEAGSLHRQLTTWIRSSPMKMVVVLLRRHDQNLKEKSDQR
ncbi:hypothetical protein FRC03_000944 [Tulasnella sp. 419]|nr:hypothetical protein FRC03_000944 [Tulasnella sp. 419]